MKYKPTVVRVFVCSRRKNPVFSQSTLMFAINQIVIVVLFYSKYVHHRGNDLRLLESVSQVVNYRDERKLLNLGDVVKMTRNLNTLLCCVNVQYTETRITGECLLRSLQFSQSQQWEVQLGA